MLAHGATCPAPGRPKPGSAPWGQERSDWGADRPSRACRSYGADLARLAPHASADAATWAQVCAPSVAVAMLLDMELR
jgi:hypothetical protein